MTHFNSMGLYHFPGNGGGTSNPVKTGVVAYASSIDPSITNLYAKVAYDSTKTNLPIVILMHGYTQDASTMTPWIMNDMAKYGLFAVAVGMRGRNPQNQTLWDISARELHDIVDAVEYVKANYGDFVDPTNVNVSGYSGGGGNVFGLAAKFPDYFNVLVSHFGISDYGYDAVNSWYATNPERQASLAQFIGFTPTTNLGAYRSRAHHLGAGKNFAGGFLFMFHDDADTNVPSRQSVSVGDQMTANSRTNFDLNVSVPSDPIRWIHASPDPNQPVRFSRDIWGPDILAKTYPQWTIAASGTALICGYLKTKLFEIWLDGGKTEVADLTYDTVAGTYTVTPLTGATSVTVKQGVKTGSATGITVATTITVV